MSKHFPECPATHHNSCTEFYNPEVCAIVRKERYCRLSKIAQVDFKVVSYQTDNEKEVYLNTENKRTGTLKGMGNYIYWRFEDLWVGHFEEYPEHIAQGETISELKKSFFKIYKLIRGAVLK